MRDNRAIIEELNEYFDGTGFFGPDVHKERTARKIGQYENDGWYTKSLYFGQLFENLEVNCTVDVDDDSTDEEIIREYFEHQAWLEFQVPPEDDGSHEEFPLEEIPEPFILKRKIYDEMADKVVEIFKKHS